MKPKTRARLLWTMAAIVVAYAMLNVIVYFMSGTYGVGWFLASLILYGAVLVATVVLFVTDREPKPEPKPESGALPSVTITPTEQQSPVVVEVAPKAVTAPRDAE